MDFSRLLGFQGRIRRSEWWLAQLIIFAAVLVTAIAVGLGSEAIGGDDDWVALPVVSIVGLGAFIGLCAAVKRLHDMDQSGWLVVPLVFAGCIPVFGWLIVAGTLGVIPGTPGPNRFGMPTLALDRNPLAAILND